MAILRGCLGYGGSAVGIHAIQTVWLKLICIIAIEIQSSDHPLIETACGKD